MLAIITSIVFDCKLVDWLFSSTECWTYKWKNKENTSNIGRFRRQTRRCTSAWDILFSLWFLKGFAKHFIKSVKKTIRFWRDFHMNLRKREHLMIIHVHGQNSQYNSTNIFLKRSFHSCSNFKHSRFIFTLKIQSVGRYRFCRTFFWNTECQCLMLHRTCNAIKFEELKNWRKIKSKQWSVHNHSSSGDT